LRCRIKKSYFLLENTTFYVVEKLLSNEIMVSLIKVWSSAERGVDFRFVCAKTKRQQQQSGGSGSALAHKKASSLERKSHYLK